MKFTTFLVALASAGAIRVDNSEKMDMLENANSDAVAEATSFDGFGGFGGFKGFHQINGLMSSAFGDLEGQFDNTGFNNDFSASQNRKFDTGYGQHFLEDLDHESFGSDLGSSSKQQKQGFPSPITHSQTAGKKYTYSAVPLPTSKYSLGQPTAGQNSYVTSKHKKVPSQYNVVPYQTLYAENLQKKQETNFPPYSAQGAVKPTFGTRKYTAKLVHQAPAVKQGSDKLKYLTKQYKSDEGFGFGAEELY